MLSFRESGDGVKCFLTGLAMAMEKASRELLLTLENAVSISFESSG